MTFEERPLSGRMRGNMKKKLVMLLLCAACTVNSFAMAGCKESEKETVQNTEKSMPVPDLAKYEFDYSEYVTLGDYSAIPVELSSDYEVTYEDVHDYLGMVFEQYASVFYMPDETKTVVAEGDVVNVNYVGKLNGEAFEGGTAEKQKIDVSGNCSADGSVTYIDGFSAGLIGAEVGTEVDCKVTFPKDYGVEELNGKEVVFTFTINSIDRLITVDELDDAAAKEYFSKESVQELYDSMLTDFTREAAYYKKTELNAKLQEYLLETCTVEVPSDYFAELYEAYRNEYIYSNCGGDETLLEQYLTTNYGYTVEQAEEEWRQNVATVIKVEFILGAIAEEMGIVFDEAAFEEKINTLVKNNNFTDENIKEMFGSYGYGDVEYGERCMKMEELWLDVLDALKETAVITVAEPAEETTESTETVESTESTETAEGTETAESTENAE